MNSGKHRNIMKDLSLTLLAEGKTIRIKAHGYSMYPCIRPGSLIIIEPVKIKGPPVPGEIIAIQRETGLIVHRLVRINKKEGIPLYIARGDSNAYPDAPVKLSMIAGRVTGAETSGENPVKADISINTNPGYFFKRLRVIALMIKKKLTAK
ncbi:MAG TPA: signal peptidase I [Bacteroidales bacterium]|nr:signal peptidase I [Bacteroidales bacterium]